MKKPDINPYATIQVDRKVKEQIVDFCDRNGFKIGRFIEKVFLDAVSGSGGTYSGSVIRR